MILPVNALARLLFFIIIFISPFCISSPAISQSIADSVVQYNAVTFAGFPANALVLLADKTEKHIEDIREDDVVAAYDPAADGYTITRVESIQQFEGKLCPVVSVMLILEDFSVSLQANGGLAGVTLQATADQMVLTGDGRKMACQLQEGDKLFCYDETSDRFNIFMVYAIQTGSYTAGKMYALKTANKTCLINNTVVLE